MESKSKFGLEPKLKNKSVKLVFSLLFSTFCVFALTGMTSTETSSFKNEVVESDKIVDAIKEKNNTVKVEDKKEVLEKINLNHIKEFKNKEQNQIKEVQEQIQDQKQNSFIEAQQEKINEIINILRKNDPSLTIYSYPSALIVTDLEKRLNENLKEKTIDIDKERNNVNYSYLIENFEDIKYRLNLYSKVFKSNQNWFLIPSKTLLLSSSSISSPSVLDAFYHEDYKILNEKDKNKKKSENIIKKDKAENDKVSALTSVSKEMFEEKENQDQAQELTSYQSLKPEENLTELSSNYLFTKSIKENQPNVVEMFVYNCKTCSRLNDVLKQHKRVKEFNHFLYPAAIKVDKDKFIIADAMIYLALKDTLKKANKEEMLEEINSQLIYDVAYKNLNIDEPKTLLKWISDKKINVEEFKKNYYNKEKAKIAKALPDLYDNLELKTLPLVLIDSKFLMLKNAVSDINNRELDSDVPMAIFDYLYLLAELERNHILVVGASSNVLPLKNKTTKK